MTTDPERLVHPDSPPLEEGKVTFDRVAFYGRTFEEYEWFFNFQAAQLEGKRVLDCHSRASSFTAEGVRKGIGAKALDPMYDQGLMSLTHLALADMEAVLEKTMAHPELYNFDHMKDFENVRKLREKAVQGFSADFSAGVAQGRYVAGRLPNLPFNDASFDLVLNNHYLFLYAAHFEYDFILESCREMARVCDLNHGGEVRLYPLMGHNARPYKHLQKLRIDLFNEDGISAEVVEIPFQYLKGSNQMLMLHRK
jgi:hypothetical protein